MHLLKVGDTCTEASWLGRESMVSQLCRNLQIFGGFNASLENVRTFAVGKDEGFEFHWKLFEIDTLLHRCHEASARAPVPPPCYWFM